MDNIEEEKNEIENLKALIDQNSKKTDQILEKVNWIRSYLKMQQIIGLIKFLLIIIPIILGLIYLPPMLKEYLDQFSALYK